MPERFAAWLHAHPRAGDAIALADGAFLVLAFAPFEWRWVAVASMVILIALWSGATPRAAFRSGYLFGLGLFGAGVSWVFNSIYVFGHAPFPVAALITVALVGFLALYPALTGLIANRLSSGRGAGWCLVAVPVVWTLMEWLRSWVLSGFPWILLGQSQVDTPLAGLFPVLGTLGSSWATLETAGLVALLALGPGRRRWGGLIGLCVLWGGVLALGQIPWVHPEGKPFRASVIQGNIAQDDKWRPENLGPTMRLYASLTRAHWDSRLILWPETAIPAFYSELAATYLDPLAREAAAHHSEIVTGIFTEDPATGAIYNSIAVLGDPPRFYHKRHLVPFGEFMPLRGLLLWLEGMIQIPMSDLSPGHGRPVLEADGVVLGASVCYEVAYGPQLMEALPEAQVLVNVSNDGWFGRSLAPHQHLEIARTRALEAGRFLLRATNTGISAIIDQQGRLVARSPQFEVDVLSAEVTPMTGLTPYARWGNWGPVTVLLLGLGTMGLFQRRARGVRRIAQCSGRRSAQ